MRVPTTLFGVALCGVPELPLVVRVSTTTIRCVGAIAAGASLFAAAPALAHDPLGRAGQAPSIADGLELRAHHEYDGGSNVALLPNAVAAGALSSGDQTTDSGIRTFRPAKNEDRSRLWGFAACAASESWIDTYGDYVLQGVGLATPAGCQPGGSERGIRVFDASERDDLRPVGFVALPNGAHTLRVHADAALVYVSPQGYGGHSEDDPDDPDGQPGTLDIVDISEPVRPRLVRRLYMPSVQHALAGERDDEEIERIRVREGVRPEAATCHEIGLHPSLPYAYCAGMVEVQVWDIRDPLDPEVVHVLRNPAITHHHSAEVSPDGRTLVVNDEAALAQGGSSPCAAPRSAIGALWFYDVSANPERPVLRSWWAPEDPLATAQVCYAHNFGFYADRDRLAVAWFEQGVFVLDFSNPAAVCAVARYRAPGTLFYDAKPRGDRVYASSVSPHVPADMFLGSGNALGEPFQGGGGLYELALTDPQEPAGAQGTGPAGCSRG